MTTPIVTTGVPTSAGPNGPVPVRREIHELQQNSPDQWNVFMLGLSEFQKVDESDDKSFYQISGIHGLPYKAWNGVTGLDGQATGYCSHSSILFLPWHRPYLALFEQLLYEQVQKVANAFTLTLRAKYVSAANDFRFPYWDWGLLPTGGVAFPAAIAGPAEIQVIGTDGNPQKISNPLFQYDFNVKNLSSSGDFPDPPFNEWAFTRRYPRDLSVNTVSQNNLVNSAVKSQNTSIRSQIRYCFGSISDFGAFSNDQWITNQPGTYPSLESIHNSIHVLTGGPGPSNEASPPGHMSIVPNAAFDPVFWLHHCNVDRMFALWQVLNPDSYVEPEPAPDGGTFTREPGATEDVNSELTPFWSDPSTFYTSVNARNTIPFGYAYPETQSWKFSDQTSYQQSVRVAISKLYGATVPSSGVIRAAAVATTKDAAATHPVLSRGIEEPGPVTASPKVTPAAGPVLSRGIEEPGHVKSSPIKEVVAKAREFIGLHGHGAAAQKPLVDNHHHPQPGSKYLEWICNIRAKKHTLCGPFQVHIFLGDVPDQTSSWLVHDVNVGTFSVLGTDPATTRCDKCKTDANNGLIVTGAIPLTEALLDCITAGTISSLEPQQVVPYLTKMLHWRVTQFDGTERQRDEVEDLQVSVVSTEVTAPTSEGDLGHYSGVYTLHPECTQGRPGGYSAGDAY